MISGGHKKYYLIYSVLFLIAAAIIYSVFVLENRSLIYTLYGDGHICFNSLIYYGTWLRRILTEHTIPMWDMKIGYGSDIFMTLSWETLGDPLNLLAVFFNAGNMEYLYDFLAIFRIYLAGLTFSVYALYHNNKTVPVLAGSMMYAFCGFVLFAGVRDVYFMSPIIYFPLLLLGIDRIFDKKKPLVLIIFTAISAIANFYYFYMLTIFVVLYAFFVFFSRYGRPVMKREYWKDFAGRFVSCALNYLAGMMIAAVQLIPLVSYIRESARGQQNYYIPVFYSLEFYAKVFSGFISSASNTAWTHLGYAPIMLPAVILLFIKKEKKYRPYKTAFIMCLLFTCIPRIGSLLNGMTYPVNRWIWAFSMLNAYIFVMMTDSLFTMSRRELEITAMLSALYGIICLIPAQLRTRQMKYMVLILALSVMVIIIGNLRHTRTEQFYEYAALVCVMTGVIANGLFRFGAFGSNYAAGFVEAGKGWSLIGDGLASDTVRGREDTAAARCDSLGDTLPMCNTSMNHGINGTDFYFSLADGNVTRFMDDENVNVEMEHRYSGLDGRTILERLAAVRYCLADSDNSVYVPYGYCKVSETAGGYGLYEDKDSLPIGYIYENMMKYSDYEKLSAVKKQQAVLQCAAVPDQVYDSLKDEVSVNGIEYDDAEAKLSVSQGNGAVADSRAVNVNGDDASLKCSIDGTAGSEMYLVIKGLTYEPDKTKDAAQSIITFTRDGESKKLILYSATHPFNHGRQDYIVNLGYDKDGAVKDINIAFSGTGAYSYRSITAVCQPVKKIDEMTERLASGAMKDAGIGTNSISGTVAAGENGILCIAVPYSSGWTVYIDGRKADTFRINSMYIGTGISGGEHRINMRYCTPYRNPGILCSFIGVIMAVAAGITGSRRKAS